MTSVLLEMIEEFRSQMAQAAGGSIMEPPSKVTRSDSESSFDGLEGPVKNMLLGISAGALKMSDMRPYKSEGMAISEHTSHEERSLPTLVSTRTSSTRSLEVDPTPFATSTGRAVSFTSFQPARHVTGGGRNQRLHPLNLSAPSSKLKKARTKTTGSMISFGMREPTLGRTEFAMLPIPTRAGSVSLGDHDRLSQSRSRSRSIGQTSSSASLSNVSSISSTDSPPSTSSNTLLLDSPQMKRAHSLVLNGGRVLEKGQFGPDMSLSAVDLVLLQKTKSYIAQSMGAQFTNLEELVVCIGPNGGQAEGFLLVNNKKRAGRFFGNGSCIIFNANKGASKVLNELDVRSVYITKFDNNCTVSAANFQSSRS